MVFQDPIASLNPRMRVGSIVSEPLAIHDPELARNERRNRAVEILAAVGLGPESLTRYPHEFSGGQRQRIGIARALILRPDLLIADEPVSALDVSVGAQILELLARLQREFSLTLVLISHSLPVVAQLATTVAVMQAGQIVEQGPAAQSCRPRSTIHPSSTSRRPPNPRIKKLGSTPLAANGSPTNMECGGLPPPGCRARLASP